MGERTGTLHSHAWRARPGFPFIPGARMVHSGVTLGVIHRAPGDTVYWGASYTRLGIPRARARARARPPAKAGEMLRSIHVNGLGEYF